MDELLKIVKAFLAKTLNISPEDAEKLLLNEDKTLKPDALQSVLNQDVQRISNMKTQFEADKTAYGETRYSAGKGESLGKIEKKFKAKYNITSDKPFEDMLDEAMTLKTDLTKLSEEQIKALPAYVALERSKTELETTMQTKIDEAVSKVKGEYTDKEETGNVMKETGAYVLSELKPSDLPQDATKAQRRVDLFLSSILGPYKAVPDGKGDRFLVYRADDPANNKKAGDRVQDEHGNAITLKNFVKKNAEDHFEFNAGTPRSGAGDPPGPGAGPTPPGGPKVGVFAEKVKKFGLIKPKDDTEFTSKFAEYQANADGLSSKDNDERMATYADLRGQKE